MIIVSYMGGLGNQMFIYALQNTLEKKYPLQVIKADVHHYNLLNEHNGFELCKYFKNIKLEYASLKETKKVFDGLIFPEWFSKLPINYNLRKKIAQRGQFFFRVIKKKLHLDSHYIINEPSNSDYCKDINFLAEGNWFIYGLWQNIKYFEQYREELIESFDFTVDNLLSDNDKKIIDELKNNELIAVHVRGGDFINPMFNLCDSSYYKKGLEKLENNKKLCIFTDDEEFARTLFPNDYIKYVVSHPIQKSIVDMYMLSQAHSMVLSNSTFAFWGAFLNKNSDLQVCCPRYATYTEKTKRPFPTLHNWIIIDK